MLSAEDQVKVEMLRPLLTTNPVLARTLARIAPRMSLKELRDVLVLAQQEKRCEYARAFPASARAALESEQRAHNEDPPELRSFLARMARLDEEILRSQLAPHNRV
jgi:hypothetical protein